MEKLLSGRSIHRKKKLFAQKMYINCLKSLQVEVANFIERKSDSSISRVSDGSPNKKRKLISVHWFFRKRTSRQEEVRMKVEVAPVQVSKADGLAHEHRKQAAKGWPLELKRLKGLEESGGRSMIFTKDVT